MNESECTSVRVGMTVTQSSRHKSLRTQSELGVKAGTPRRYEGT